MVCIRLVVPFRRFARHFLLRPILARALRSIGPGPDSQLRPLFLHRPFRRKSRQLDQHFGQVARVFGRVRLAWFRPQVLLGVRRDLRQALHWRRSFSGVAPLRVDSPNYSIQRTAGAGLE